MKDVNSNESNIGEESHSFDRQGSLEVDPTLIGSLDINYGCCHVDAILFHHSALPRALIDSASVRSEPISPSRSIEVLLHQGTPLKPLTSLFSFRHPLSHSSNPSKTPTTNPLPSSSFESQLLIPPSIEPNEVDDSTVLPGSNITVGPYTGDS
ncbi:hypothetical protein JHK84_043817 [Glycine max]|nr:hypothetical protein JHK84_043817 [Glycine max]